MESQTPINKQVIVASDLKAEPNSEHEQMRRLKQLIQRLYMRVKGSNHAMSGQQEASTV